MTIDRDGDITLEQQEDEAPISGLMPEPEPALPAPSPDQPRPRGRPFVKGQSGNPAGRPPRIHPPAAVAEYIIARKTIPLAKKLREMALAGGRSMLRLWFQHVAPRCNAADWPALPLVHDRAELRGLREAVTEAAEKGAGCGKPSPRPPRRARSARRRRTRSCASSTRSWACCERRCSSPPWPRLVSAG